VADQVLDAKGLNCPLPILKAKKALKSLQGGQTLEVLVEGPSKKPHLNKAENENNPQLIGRTAHDYIVVFNGPESLTGRFVNVTVTKTAPLTLFAKLT